MRGGEGDHAHSHEESGLGTKEGSCGGGADQRRYGGRQDRLCLGSDGERSGSKRSI